ncbi:MAG: hypothetical protein R3213_11715 [Flavobacteriaceae bacterium]|nr:hypothetical protein [Flavobacteriaceae bacterium]
MDNFTIGQRLNKTKSIARIARTRLKAFRKRKLSSEAVKNTLGLTFFNNYYHPFGYNAFTDGDISG